MQHVEIRNSLPSPESLAAEINRTGMAMIPNFVSPSELGRMKNFVAEKVAASNGQYVGFTKASDVAGSGLDELGQASWFKELLHGVYEAGTGKPGPDVEFYQVLRCLTGPSAARHSYLFHYDSYVLTMLIPVEIPTSGMTGDFMLFPNSRKIRKTYLGNVIDKILLDNRLTQWALRILVKRRMLNIARVKMVPGNAYFFWGYRSIHTNEPCDPDKVRATAIFHYVNPHERKWASAMA